MGKLFRQYSSKGGFAPAISLLKSLARGVMKLFLLFCANWFRLSRVSTLHLEVNIEFWNQTLPSVLVMIIMKINNSITVRNSEVSLCRSFRCLNQVQMILLRIFLFSFWLILCYPQRWAWFITLRGLKSSCCAKSSLTSNHRKTPKHSSKTINFTRKFPFPPHKLLCSNALFILASCIKPWWKFTETPKRVHFVWKQKR